MSRENEWLLWNNACVSTVAPGTLSAEQRAELSAAAGSRLVDGQVATRARMVLWFDEGRPAKEIAELAQVSDNTARVWPERYLAGGLGALENAPHPGKGEQVPGEVRGRVLAVSRMTRRGISG